MYKKIESNNDGELGMAFIISIFLRLFVGSINPFMCLVYQYFNNYNQSAWASLTREMCTCVGWGWVKIFCNIGIENYISTGIGQQYFYFVVK